MPLKSKQTRSFAQALALIAFVLVASHSATADSLRGEVVGLADGDTITVLDSTKQQHKIRIAGIDAPEKRQPHGQTSKDSLASMVFRQQVTVQWSKRDRYGRLVGKVIVGGRDAGLEQVSRGMAWHYKAYMREQSSEDQERYARAEQEARTRTRGLWKDAHPVAPWDFRHRR